MGQGEFTNQYGSIVALVMSLGFLINVLIARFTPFKYIYLTGHMMFWTTTIFAGIVVQSSPDVGFWQLVIFLSVIMGVYWALQPAIVQPFMRKVTGNDQIALGHTSASVSLIAALLGKWFGNKENDSEKIKVPEGLEFLRDSNVITALTMGLLFVTGAIIVSLRDTPGAAELVASSGEQNRMFIGEMVPAFKGIATKIVPGAKPALDSPIVFPYAPNAVILGFLGAFVGGLIWLFVLGNTVAYVFVPTMIVLFFHGATAGVFGNATGGARGAVIGGFMTATIVAWGQYVMVRMLLSDTIPDTAMWAADSDMFILGPVIKMLAQLFF